jgi:AraC family transcriptional regulator, transcriptional activator of pobA
MSKLPQEKAPVLKPAASLMNGQVLFNVKKFDVTGNGIVLAYSRRDYYKIWTVTGESNLHYANKSIHINQPALIFSNPLVPYSFESLSDNRFGYMSIFTESFLKGSDRQESIQQSPLFKIGSNAVFFPDEKQQEMLAGFYEKMLEEIATDYIYKYDVLKNYVNLIIHEAMKMQPA